MPPLTRRYPSAAGIIEAVAKDFFDIDVTLEILDVHQEEERTAKKEHVVFLIVQKSHRQMRRAKPKDSQRDQEVQGLLCLQNAQFLLAEQPVLEQYAKKSIPGVRESGRVSHRQHC